jgi:hypothetical protein
MCAYLQYNHNLESASVFFLALVNNRDLEAEDDEDELDTPGSVLIGLLAALKEDMPSRSATDLFFTGEDRKAAGIPLLRVLAFKHQSDGLHTSSLTFSSVSVTKYSTS